jgi:phospholipid/cholesterol/gamma-HCH transport system substrate-binding protein
MVKLTKEVKVGVTITLALLILGWGINFLKGKDVFLSGYKLVGIYSNIDGLTEASPIYYKGFKIGTVREISIQNGSEGLLVVTMVIEEDIHFPKNTVAQIYSLDLMGSKGIRFIYGDDSVMLKPGDIIETSVTGDLADQVSQEVMPLKHKAENLVMKMDSVFSGIEKVIKGDQGYDLALAISNFKELSSNIQSITASIDKSLKTEGSLGSSLANIDSFTSILKDKGEVLSGTMDNLNVVSQQLANTKIDSVVDQLDKTLNSVNKVIKATEEGEGTLGMLLNDKQLYTNLNETAVSLDRLLNDVRSQPKKYVSFSAISFGGKKYKKEEPEEIVYKVLLVKSKEPLELRGKEVFEGYFIYEDRDEKYYLYTLGEDINFENISVLKDKVVEMYPEAHVIAYKVGGPVKVTSPLK